MPNGERLSGTVVKSERGILYFETAYLGVVQVPVYQSKVLTEEEAEATPPESIEWPSEALLEEGRSLFIWENKPPSWSGEIQFGYGLKSGQVDSSSTALDATLNIDPTKHPKDHYQWEAFYHYGEQDDTKDTDEYGLSHRYRRDWTSESFFQSLTSYQADRIKRIRHQLDQSFGLGYTLVNNEKVVLDIVFGPAVEYLDQPGDQDGIDYFGDFQENLQWTIHPSLYVYQSFNFMASLTDSENYKYDLYLGLETVLFGPFSLHLAYEIDYDNAVESSIEKKESILTTAIGYTF